jgi:hypothetical protein
VDRPEAGWFPAGDGALRWWDGEHWTDQVVHPVRRVARVSRRASFGIGLLAVGAVVLAITAVIGIGDSSPITRAGVTRSRTALTAVSLLCPGEQTTAIELRRAVGNDPNGQGPLLWKAEGEAAPAEFTVGVAPDGMHDVVTFAQALRPGERLVLRVVTSEVSPRGLEFTLDDVPSSGYWGAYGLAASKDELERDARSNAPCGDPYRTHSRDTTLWAGGIIGLGAALVGVMLLVQASRRTRRPAPAEV